MAHGLGRDHPDWDRDDPFDRPGPLWYALTYAAESAWEILVWVVWRRPARWT